MPNLLWTMHINTATHYQIPRIPARLGLIQEAKLFLYTKVRIPGHTQWTVHTWMQSSCYCSMLPRILLCKKCVCVCVCGMHIRFIVIGCLYKSLSQPHRIVMRLLLVLLCVCVYKKWNQANKNKPPISVSICELLPVQKKYNQNDTQGRFMYTCESSNMSFSCVISDFHSFSFALVWASCSTRLLLWRSTTNCMSFINSRFACKKSNVYVCNKLRINFTSSSLCGAATATGGGAATAAALSIQRRGGWGGNPSGWRPEVTMNKGNATQCSAVSIRFSGLK